ncbi:MAG TPA: M50 family metallopeptidase [Kofleriaceae bacterium]|nr:M50 family metallopeptidase [Kofleriaceae bacterium]
MWIYWTAAIFSLAFLIVVHEGGHYFVARWCGMRIERFSIGFGPGIFKRRSKKTGTVFQIAPIPFGGFVEIRGMNIAEDVDPDDRAAYPNRPAWQRFLTIFAGPATNYLSAMVLAFFLYWGHGVNSTWRWFGVAAVDKNYDAFGKLETGDRILEVDHVPLMAAGEYHDGAKVYTQDSLTGRVTAKKGAPVVITVLRDGKKLDVTVLPTRVAGPAQQLGELMDAQLRACCNLPIKHGDPRYLMGIVPSEDADVIHVGIGTAFVGALEYPVLQTKMIAGGIYHIFTGEEKADPGGPKRIFDEFAKAWQLGFLTGIQLLMALSVYLGLFNLFPLPALDGGRLVFLGYEMVTRRRANPKIEAMVHMGGIMVLGVVMILVTLRDFHVFS